MGSLSTGEGRDSHSPTAAPCTDSNHGIYNQDRDGRLTTAQPGYRGESYGEVPGRYYIPLERQMSRRSHPNTDSRIRSTQCVTDKLRDQSKLTVPIYTDICSARCYTGNSQLPPNDCPYNGKRLDGRGTAGSNQVDKAVADRFLG